MAVNIVTVHVPSIYDVYGRLPKKKSVSRQAVSGLIPIEVKTVSPHDLKPAFSVERGKQQGFEIFLVDGLLYCKSGSFNASHFYELICCDAFEGVLRQLERSFGYYSDGLHFRYRDDEKPIAEASIPEAGFRAIAGDSKRIVQDEMQRHADQYIVIGDDAYFRCGEPYYGVIVYGAGIHSSGFVKVASFMTEPNGDIKPERCSYFFSALHFEDCLLRVKKLAGAGCRTIDPNNEIITVHDPAMVKVDGGSEYVFTIKGDDAYRNVVFKKQSDAQGLVDSHNASKRQRLSFERMLTVEFNALSVLEHYIDDREKLECVVSMIRDCDSAEAIFDELALCRKVSFINREYVVRLSRALAGYKIEHDGSMIGFEVLSFGDFVTDVGFELRALEVVDRQSIGMQE